MSDNASIEQGDFEETFKEFDKDGSGTIEKDEMAAFIKKVAGLWVTSQITEWVSEKASSPYEIAKVNTTIWPSLSCK